MTKLPSPREVAAELRSRATSQSKSLRELMVIAAQMIEHLMQQLVPQTNARGDVELVITSGYGADNQKPFVQLAYGGAVLQLSPEQARQQAMYLFEAAEAAKTDALFYEFVQSNMALDTQTAGRLLVAMRAYRVKQDGKKAQSA
jgi:hypothetical protein